MEKTINTLEKAIQRLEELRDYVSISEFAERTGLAKSTVYNYVYLGRIEYKKLEGRKAVFIHKDQIERFMKVKP